VAGSLRPPVGENVANTVAEQEPSAELLRSLAGWGLGGGADEESGRGRLLEFGRGRRKPAWPLRWASGVAR
jgi:hypothetical protein